MTRYALTALSQSACGFRAGSSFLAALLSFLFLCLLTPKPALCAAPSRLVVSNPSLYAFNENLQLDVSVTVDDEDGLRDMLKDGAVLELKLTIILERNRSWWSNADLSTVSYVSIIRHDPLSRDFMATVPGKAELEQHRDRNLTRLLHATWRKLSLPVTSLRTIEAEGQDKDYTISVAITLRHTEVPPWLEKNLVFWSAEVVPQIKLELGYQPAIE